MVILFSDLCLLFDRIATNASRSQKGKERESTPPEDILAAWIAALDDPSHRDGLLIFRLLFPEHDIRRRYGLKETLLAHELPTSLGFSASTRLGAWDRETSSDRRKHGCFGFCLQEVLEHRRTSTAASSMDISQLDSLLDELASHCEFSSKYVKQPRREGRVRPRGVILHALFSSLSPIEAGYMSQIILRDLSPMLYPIPSLRSDIALLEYNSTHYKPLELVSALKTWHWTLPTIYRYRADLDAAFKVLIDRPISTCKN